ncbi:MAG: RNA polymerase sigma factor [Acidobacteria bacterium]|nr:RNA polymerase sigma factor [Acidobacteriota bacterium]
MKAPKAFADERLRIEAAQKDPSRFAELYEENFERVYGYVARRVENRAAAEDVTSEVFHHALANLERFEWRGTPFVAWLLRIAHNLLVDRWQRAGRESSQPAPEVGDATWKEVEQRALLFQLVDRLPADQRRVIYLRFTAQKTIAEIARELGRSEGAVKQLQFRALENLRARMKESHG